jgi:RNA polymerase sigma-70 factor (ECF subfamily)
MGVAVGMIKSRVSRARDRLALIYAEGRIVADHLPAHTALSAICSQIDHLKCGRAA